MGRRIGGKAFFGLAKIRNVLFEGAGDWQTLCLKKRRLVELSCLVVIGGTAMFGWAKIGEDALFFEAEISGRRLYLMERRSAEMPSLMRRKSVKIPGFMKQKSARTPRLEVGRSAEMLCS